jgi:hypothetical protein
MFRGHGRAGNKVRHHKFPYAGLRRHRSEIARRQVMRGQVDLHALGALFRKVRIDRLDLLDCEIDVDHFADQYVGSPGESFDLAARPRVAGERDDLVRCLEP